MAPSEIDFYKTLAVHRHATDDDIKKAFRKAARDTHPDKNPDDPLAKEKFQELQRAYDTLKDQLERSKYDEDNPYHGLPEGSRPKPKSTTAKRYTASSSTGPTGPTGTPPGWATGSGQFTRGFPHQAHQTHQAHPTPSSHHTGGHKTTYGDFTGSTYDGGGARRQRSGGFDFEYGSSYRPQQPATDFSEGYYNGRDRSYERSESPRTREGVYTRTNSQRKPNATQAGTPKSSGSNRRAHSTVGGQRDPNAQGPDINIGAYIRERRAMEEEQARRDEEVKRRREEEAKRAARDREEREEREAIRRRKEEIKRRHMELRRAEDQRRAEEEARRAEEEARSAEEAAARRRSHWAKTDGSQFPRNGFARPDIPEFHGDSRDEDLLRTVDERIAAEGQRKPKTTSTTASRSSSRRSPTRSKPRRDNIWEANGHPDGWGTKSGSVNDHSGPFHRADGGEGVGYQEDVKRENERQAAQQPEQQREQPEQQRKWEEILKGSGIPYQGHGRAKSETQPRERPGTPDRPRTSGHESPLESASGGSKRGSPSFNASNNKRRQSSNDFRFKFPPGMARVDSYRSEPRASPPPPRDSPFQKQPDFCFHGEVPSPFTYTTPEERSQQNPNNLRAASPQFTRPQSQPVYPTQPQHIPVSRPTPQPQQQQKRQQQLETSGFKKELYEGLAQTAYTLFNYQPLQSSPKKKKSAPSFKSSSKFRTKGKESVNADGGNVGIKVELGNGSEGGSGSTQPKKTGIGEAGTPHVPVIGDEVFEPMDTGPDTGIPDPIHIQAAKFNGHMGPRSPIGNQSPRIPTPISPRSTKEDGLDTMHKLASVYPLKVNGLDTMGNLANTLPLSHSPAGVGLDDGINLFSSRSSSTPKPGFAGPLPKFKPDIYGPATPTEDLFCLPVAPKVPKTPKEIDLKSYNQFFMKVETYVELWNVYEDKVHKLQASLCRKNLKDVTLDTNAIMDYIKRVKEKDFVLEESYRQAREKHISALDDWVRYRTTVVANKNNS